MRKGQGANGATGLVMLESMQRTSRADSQVSSRG